MTPTIQTEIELLKNTKDELRTAIMEKGVTVSSNDLFSTYPTRISQISMTHGDKDNLFKSLIDRSITSFVVPDGTEILRPYAFEGCENITSIILPNSLQTICNGALTGLQGITTLVIPDSVTTIEGSSSFHQTSSLTTLTIGTGITSIGNMVFYGNPNLTSIMISATIPPVLGSNNNAFDNTNNSPIYVPEESVEDYKLAWSKYASRIQAMPSYKAHLVLTDNSSVFLDDDGTGMLTANELASYKTTLKNLNVIYDVVNTVDDETFKGFSNLETVNLDYSVTTIGDYAFDNCPKLEVFEAPGLTDWGMCALRWSGLTYYEIPEGITKTDTTFGSCSQLEEVIFPEGFLELGRGTFVECTSLKNPVLPETLSIISAVSTFYGCTGLESITFLSQYPPTVIEAEYTNDMFDNTNDCPIYVPADSVDYYKQANGWSKYASRIQAIPVPSKMIITNDNGGTIETISVPEDHICNVEEMSYPTTIMDCDFYELPASLYPENIRTITICENITQIDLGLMGCTGLESITIEATTPPVLGGGFNDVETNDCPIYVPAESLQDYLDDPNWSIYSSRLQAIPEPQPVDPYPELESVQIFKIKENLNDVTSGKYIIQGSGHILNASLIETTTGTGNGINNYSSGNTISFSGYRMGDGICQVNANTLNAAMDYDATNHTLSWTNTNNNTTYYLSQRTTTSSNFKYSGTTTAPTTTITVAQVNSNRNLTFKQNYALGYGSPAISWYYASNSSAFTGIYLYKLETVSAAPVATFTLSDTSEVKVYDYSGNNANLTFDFNNTMPYNSTVVEALIKRNVEEIGHDAFYNFQYLETVTIPDSVDTIGDNAFENCSSLTSLTVKATYPPTLGSGVFTNTNANLVIYVPAESVNDYKAASGWSDYASKIQAIS